MNMIHPSNGRNTVAQMAQQSGWMARMIREEITWNRKDYKCAVMKNHCRVLAQVFRKRSLFIKKNREVSARLFQVLESKTSLFNDPKNTLYTVHVFIRVVGYAHEWMRQPEDWQPSVGLNVREQFHSLIHHLFCQYEMPGFFCSIWLENSDLFTHERDTFCYLAKGGSLRKVEVYKKFTKRSIHCMMQAPDEFTFTQATQWGHARAVGMSEEQALEFAKVSQPTSLKDGDIWMRFIQICKQSEELLSCHEIDLLVGYLRFEKAEKRRNAKRLSLDKVSLDLLVKRSQTLWRNLSEMALEAGLIKKIDLASKHDRNDLIKMASHVWTSFDDANGMDLNGWKLFELCSFGQLALEGRQMSNCVKSYANACSAGPVSIWTLKRVTDGKIRPAVTIAVNRKKRVITEARGLANRALKESEYKVVKLWAEKNELKLAI